MSQLGPAANSGRSILLYGEPGNGKTSIAEALGKSFKDVIFMPHATIVGNQIIRFFDETLHEVAELPEGATKLDTRWVPCHRPVVISGGELTLDMLDLRFEATSRFYEAPMHLKALGGVFVLDDFGRQVSTPQEFLNRWIVPLEKGFDIMSLHTGKKFTIPFDQLVVFSSNMIPEELGDGAALRRIYFKIMVPSPTREEYVQIFSDACNERGIEFKPDVVNTFFDQQYEAKDIVTSGAHPGFLLQHVKAICRYLDRDAELTVDLLEIAWKNVAKSKRRDAIG
nr:AAA family ATPase [Sulfitobacter aestuariivivens]